jgi:hypothetical protein
MSAADVIGTGKGYQMTDTGIVFDRVLTDDELDALGVRIARIANATGWAIGDWLVAGNGRGPGGKSYDRAGQLTGKSYETLSQYARVSAAYAHGERSLAPWSMYREALRLPAGNRIEVLQLARDNHWNRSGLVEYINLRLGENNAIERGPHSSAERVKRVASTRGWRGQNQVAPKRDVKCPSCGHRFDVRRKGLTDAPIQPTARKAVGP